MNLFFLSLSRDDSFELFQPKSCLISDVIRVLLDILWGFFRWNANFRKKINVQRKIAEDVIDQEMVKNDEKNVPELDVLLEKGLDNAEYGKAVRSSHSDLII